MADNSSKIYLLIYSVNSLHKKILQVLLILLSAFLYSPTITFAYGDLYETTPQNVTRAFPPDIRNNL